MRFAIYRTHHVTLLISYVVSDLCCFQIYVKRMLPFIQMLRRMVSVVILGNKGLFC
jgi:hypothetical protein